MTPSPPDPSLPARLREFHERLPLAGDPPNALLSLPDDRILYLAAILRDTPVPAPALSLDEWREFRDLLKPHGVFPLLAYRLRAWPAECRPPAEVMAWLNRVFLFAAARAMRAGRQIQEVVDALEGAGIPSVLLKGPALARTVYPDPALRQSSDIDILVRPADVLAAEGVLEGLGYVSPKKEFHISQHEYYHQIFEPSGNGMTIELHWALDNAFDIVPQKWVDETIDRRIRVSSNGLNFFAMTSTDHLLYLSLHNVIQHPEYQLNWMHDVSLLMQGLVPDDWMDLVGHSVEYHMRIPLELTVAAAVNWTNIGLSGKNPVDLAWPPPTEQERKLWQYTSTRHTSLFSLLASNSHGQPGIVNKLGYLYRLVLPPSVMMSPYRRSNSRLEIPLAYFRRWATFAEWLRARSE